MKEYKSNVSEISLKRIKSDIKKVKITSSLIASNFARNFFHEDITIYESFFIILMNRSNNTIGYAKISQGGVAGTVVDPKIVAKYCVDTLSSACILVHNHPSGNKKPSQEDINITKKVRDGLKLFDINVLDHIILTDEEYLSMADEGLI